jgi:hypothetical protein
MFILHIPSSLNVVSLLASALFLRKTFVIINSKSCVAALRLSSLRLRAN